MSDEHEDMEIARIAYERYDTFVCDGCGEEIDLTQADSVEEAYLLFANHYEDHE